MRAFGTALGRCGIEWSDAGITRVLLPGKRRMLEIERAPGFTQLSLLPTAR